MTAKQRDRIRRAAMRWFHIWKMAQDSPKLNAREQRAGVALFKAWEATQKGEPWAAARKGKRK